MRDCGDEIDPAEAMLAELAGLDLTLARHVHACAMAHDDPEVVADLARAYQRVARSARMTLALHARLKRERLRGGAADDPPAPAGPSPPPPPPTPRQAAEAERRRSLRTALRRIAWAEREAEPEAEPVEATLERVERRLARRDLALRRILQGDLLDDTPLDHEVVVFCRLLGLPEAAAEGWRDLPDPPAADARAPQPALADSS